MKGEGTYSESWYRIAGHRVALRPHVVVRRQYFRGERYFVLHDPFSNQFFRVRPSAYEFIARLSVGRTVESVWHESIEKNPEEAPGQEQALRLLGQLHSANLLHSDIPPDTAKMFEGYEKRRSREVRSRWLNLLFTRFPLLDPDSFLKRLLPVLRAVFSIPGAIVWLIVVAAGGKVAIDHAGEFGASAMNTLEPGNLLLLYAATLISKVVHESGHACVCRRLGGEVHVMGVMLMVFTPLPYVDTTSSWAFRSRWARAFVGSAGMIAELFLAALATFVWAATGEGTLHSLAFNVIFVASVSTLVFNLNPLLRFDGYYILSDLLEIPNLQIRAARQFVYWLERFAFGVKHVTPVAASRREAMWLGIYFVASTTYRLLVTAAILIFVAGQFLILGLLLAATGLVAWLVTPSWRGIRYLARAPVLGRQRRRAAVVSGGALALALALLLAIPFPDHLRAPGVVESTEYSVVSTASAGKVAEVLTPSGSMVEKGQPLLRLENAEQASELAEAEARLVETQLMRRQALTESVANLDPIDARIAAIEKIITQLRAQQKSLIIRAEYAGLWHAPLVSSYVGEWIPRGMEVGQTVGTRNFRFSVVVSQEDASRLFENELRGGEVRLRGQAERVLHVRDVSIIPAERRNLPSAALGGRGGGEVAVAAGETRREARESFFEARAALAPDSGVVLTHGASGSIRFELPPEPLGLQWVRRFMQMLQKRFGV
jgi:putative peptide zinc metalloprotease protein